MIICVRGNYNIGNDTGRQRNNETYTGLGTVLEIKSVSLVDSRSHYIK